jgi:hypothetical protein
MPEIPVAQASRTKQKHQNEPATSTPATPEAGRPFQLDLVYVTTSQQDADRFVDYIRDNYAGFVRLAPIPNLGSGISNAIVFHYSMPHASATFMQGLYAFLTSPETFLWLGIDGEPPQLYAGRE